MAKLIIKEITHCKDCPFKYSTPYPTADSWEMAEYWWCKHPDNDIVIEEKVKIQDLKIKLFISLNDKNSYKKIRYIQGYVKWIDEKHITCPNWCPLPDKIE